MIGSTLSAVDGQSLRGLIASRTKDTISKMRGGVNSMCEFVTRRLLSVPAFLVMQFRSSDMCSINGSFDIRTRSLYYGQCRQWRGNKTASLRGQGRAEGLLVGT